MNFEDLLRRAKEGEAEAIRQIHRMYRPPVEKPMLYQKCGNCNNLIVMILAGVLKVLVALI